MKLIEYLEKYNIGPLEFCVKCNCGVSSLYRWLRGERPNYRRARQLEKLTNGEVTVEELLNEPPDK